MKTPVVVIIFPLPVSIKINVLEGGQTDQEAMTGGGGEGREGGTEGLNTILYIVSRQPNNLLYSMDIEPNFQDSTTFLRCVIPSSFWILSDFLLRLRLCQFSKHMSCVIKELYQKGKL